jgi:hypothetical protein
MAPVSVFSQIKREKAKVETNRTIAKIHVSCNAARTVTREMVKKQRGEYHPVTSNGSDTLLGCVLVIHMQQVDDFWFEDTQGQKILAGFSFF